MDSPTYHPTDDEWSSGYLAKKLIERMAGFFCFYYSATSSSTDENMSQKSLLCLE